ncbi:MAG: high frequency lysogenization protein HflD [Pseudomonadota bacterium]|jgi:high frequency lysogenization protein
MSIPDITLGLAGIFQAAELVKQIARQGSAQETPLQASVASLFVFDAQTTAAVFGGVQGVRLGLEMLLTQLGANNLKRDAESLRYTMGMMDLQRRFMRDKKLPSLLHDGLQQIVFNGETIQPATFLEIAHLYTNTLSTLPFRIQVFGRPDYLQDEEKAAKIRALLLAGVRSAVLWEQKGGGRWHLLWNRNKILKQAELFLRSI